MLLTKSTTWLMDHSRTSAAAGLHEWAAQLKRQFAGSWATETLLGCVATFFSA